MENLKRKEQKSKTWDELTLADHIIFQKFMMDDEMCKEVLSEILGAD